MTGELCVSICIETKDDGNIEYSFILLRKTGNKGEYKVTHTIYEDELDDFEEALIKAKKLLNCERIKYKK